MSATAELIRRDPATPPRFIAMTTVATVERTSMPSLHLDDDTRVWLDDLRSVGDARQAAVARPPAPLPPAAPLLGAPPAARLRAAARPFRTSARRSSTRSRSRRPTMR